MGFHSRPPGQRGALARQRDPHLLSHVQAGRDQSACALLIKLFPSGGPAWLPAAAGPGCWLTLSPFLHPGPPRRQHGFSAHRRGRAGEAGNCRASPLWRASESTPPRPWHSAGALGARRRLGLGCRHSDQRRSLLSLNSSSTSPSPTASGPGDTGSRRCRGLAQILSAPPRSERGAGPPGASPRPGAEGWRGGRKGPQSRSSAPPVAQLRGRLGEWRRPRARRRRRGAGTRALVGAGSGAGRAGPGRRRRRRRALELLADGEESRAAGAELEEAASATRAAG